MLKKERERLFEKDEITGKRGAVRNNSGLPVDHSGPGLRVEPGTPITSGRKPEACPLDSEQFAFGFGVEFGADLGAAGSQHKSGRESESGALSGGSEASDMLRSAATQQLGSSLDLTQNNRYTSAAIELQKRGRKRHCGSRTLRGLTDGREKVVRLDCKTWTCAYCGPRKAWRYKQAISAVAERHGLNRLLTLTLDPAKIEGVQSDICVRYSTNSVSTYCASTVVPSSTSPFSNSIKAEFPICTFSWTVLLSSVGSLPHGVLWVGVGSLISDTSIFTAFRII